MTTEKIRKDLLDIRYYYARKTLFDRAANCIAKNATIRKAEQYNRFVENAPPKLYDIYIMLYVKSNTQRATAEKLGYSECYIRRLNKQLYTFFQNAFAADRRKDRHGSEKKQI